MATIGALQISFLMILIWMAKGDVSVKLTYSFLAVSLLIWLTTKSNYDLYQDVFILNNISKIIIGLMPLFMLRLLILTLSDATKVPYWFNFFATIIIVVVILHSTIIATVFDNKEPYFILVTLQVFILTLCVGLLFVLKKLYEQDPKIKHRLYFNALAVIASWLVWLDVTLINYFRVTLDQVSIVANLIILLTALFYSVRVILVQEVGYKTQLWLESNVDINESPVSSTKTLGSKKIEAYTSAQSHNSFRTHSSEAKNLLDIMLNKKPHLDCDLKHQELAQLASLKEATCRKIIVEEMGFKNFNRFINYHRVKDAKKRILKSPERPFLSISFEVGFKSVSAFNQAFQIVENMTPSQFRTKNL